jgi:PhnB protein
MIVQSYLNFDGRCEEAVEFYKKALGAEVEMLLRFKDNPEPPNADCPMPADPNKVMHTALRIGDTVIMASDCECTGNPDFKGISLALTVADEAEADRAFGALADGGQTLMPLTKTFFSPKFGMAADKFGISWMIMVPPEQG